jgi:hypothetical protein
MCYNYQMRSSAIANPIKLSLIIAAICGTMLAACVQQPNGIGVSGNNLIQTSPFSSPLLASQTPFQPQAAAPTVVSTPEPKLRLWIDSTIPKELRQSWSMPVEVQLAESAGSASLVWDLASPSADSLETVVSGSWIYALVVPFPTVMDGVTASQVRNAWHGQKEGLFGDSPILMDDATREVFSKLWGAPANGAIQTLPAESLADTAWNQRVAWAIVPFQNLEPRWKVLSVDGVSPLSKEFKPESYALSANYVLRGKPEPVAELRALLQLKPGKSITLTGNRDASKLTILIMTGTTALVRETAVKMDENGVTYPGRDIRDVLRDADITHISNEVSFSPNCPPPNGGSTSLRFCSDPKFIGLLEDVGARIVELSGNHVNDWGTDALSYTLQLYQQHHIPYFAGGANITEARQAVILEDHGNRLAFIGCNPAGPLNAWATDNKPGAAPCDYEWEHNEIQRLRGQGILPIVTFQYPESYDPSPLPSQQKDFRGMITAGAEIVSGSQAHYPQGLELDQGKLIHYGLGNLFFDQQNFINPVTGKHLEGTRWEFIDRHVIYAGRHISTELLTYILEDWSKPRPMTAEEREALLKYIFKASGWK